MPFIDSKISIPVSQEQKETLKTDFGHAISILNKPESFLMLGFEDNYDLYMGGKKLDKGAYVSVKLFGSASAREYNSMTAEICRILEERLGIPGNAVYVTYQGINDWGWDGKNF